jgi:anti-sigma factor RsiW
MADNPHELSALYALDVLDDDERARYEEHLAGCERCQVDLLGLREAAAGIGFVATGPSPPAALRERVLERVRAEPINVTRIGSRRPSFALSIAAVVAVAATAAAVGLGVWAASLHHSLSHEQAAVSVLGDPHARRVPVQGVAGSLVVAPSGKAALAVDLPAPPAGKTYEAWVIDGGVHADRLFDGAPTLLERRVGPGTTVKVTLETAGGVDAPTTFPLLSVHV